MSERSSILYVDDERGNLNAFKNTFRRDYNIFLAESAAEGIEILENEKIDLILSDQRMPEMSGVEFLRRTKENHPHPNRILVTAYSDFEAIQNAINEAHIFKFVKKPWNPNQFKSVIDHALDSYNLKRRNDELREQLSSNNMELELANKSLAESDQLKDDFLQIISHEMRTPLNGLKGATQLLKYEINTDDHSEAKSLYNILEASTSRLEQFLLLAERITSLKAKNYKLKNEAVDVLELIANAANELEQFLQENSLTLNISNCDCGIVEADNETLAICIREVIHNAIKHSPIGSEISIMTTRNSGSLSIEIADNGSGFSETVLNNIFKIFVRDDDHRDRSLGLSLALVKLVMDLHNGEVTVHNRTQGGAIVLLKLQTTTIPPADDEP